VSGSAPTPGEPARSPRARSSAIQLLDGTSGRWSSSLMRGSPAVITVGRASSFPVRTRSPAARGDQQSIAVDPKVRVQSPGLGAVRNGSAAPRAAALRRGSGRAVARRGRNQSARDRRTGRHREAQTHMCASALEEVQSPALRELASTERDTGSGRSADLVRSADRSRRRAADPLSLEGSMMGTGTASSASSPVLSAGPSAAAAFLGAGRPEGAGRRERPQAQGAPRSRHQRVPRRSATGSIRARNRLNPRTMLAMASRRTH
jgi:hypothetical protein